MYNLGELLFSSERREVRGEGENMKHVTMGKYFLNKKYKHLNKISQEDGITGLD